MMVTFVRITIICLGFILTPFIVCAQSTSGWNSPLKADLLKNPFAQNEEAAKKGKKLYNQLCAICHGNKGKGDGIAGAALKPRPADFNKPLFTMQTDGAIFWKITTGKSPMAAYKGIIKDDEIWSIITYIRYLSKTPKK